MQKNTLGILNSVAAFIIAVLSGLGVGSGGLLVAYLAITGQAGSDVRGINLFFFIISAGVASLLNIRSRKFDGKLIFIMSAFGIIGCLFGTYAAKFISADSVRRIFGGLLALSGGYVLLSGVERKRKKIIGLHK